MARKSQLTGPAVNGKKKLNGKEYGRELRKLQTELVEMQEWVKATGAGIVVVFEGRDAAGKAISVISLMLLTKVITWNDIAANKQAWGVLVWFATLVAMADALNTVGFLKSLVTPSLTRTPSTTSLSQIRERSY